MERICSRCGSSSFHYNHSRMRMECDLCGTPIYDSQQDQQLMQYDRTYSQAMNHLVVGNWEQTITLLNPLLGQYPTEKKLYLAVLRAATHDFIDIDMENTSLRFTASDAWNKLDRLNSVTSEMLRYSRQRYEKHRYELDSQKNRILIWIFMAAFSSFMSGILFAMLHYFLGIMCIGGLIGCLYKIFSYHPFLVLKQLLSDVPDYRNNPFI